MAYQVSFKASVDKALDKLPRAIQTRVVQKAIALCDNPRPPGAVKLVGSSGLWRIRIGDYRMGYLIDDQTQTVEVRILAHRRDVYRNL